MGGAYYMVCRIPVMTCKDCIHLQPNTEHCNEYDIEVDIKPYRICAAMEVKDENDTPTEDSWESVSK